MRARLLILALCLVTAAPAGVAGQTKPVPAAPPPPVAPPPPPPPPPRQPESYTYEPAGRRDPFTNLLGIGSGPRVTLTRGEGKAGLVVAELSVRGVMQNRGGFLAMVQGPDGKTFLLRAGDKLADGTVRAVNAEGIVVVQDVNDPLSLVKQREVSKKLRSLEAKQ
jgi:Tfp pilus assembly protein PilP